MTVHEVGVTFPRQYVGNLRCQCFSRQRNKAINQLRLTS
ncbi:TPA: hypothetical protein ACIBXF_004382 [Salmonella enterica subsp. enterica serovar Mississippi]|nr:hypothetical protein LFZ35_15650 [Salmonella enterica subsp. enterica serovar Onderstepoort str. SA20060086]EJC3693035.1 hypothetical protein [Salmonella enterica]EJM4053595.1 hypothetical protein [Salmonella enterica]